MFLSVIIVYFKTPHLLINCLESLNFSKDYLKEYETIVVDNNSGDNAKAITIKKFSYVNWQNSHYNAGFGRANNLGINYSKGDYILLLNSDMIVSSENIQNCLIELQEKPEIGVLGCKLLNEDSTPQKSTYSVASFRKLLDQNLVINKLWPMGEEPIEAVMGSFMLIPRKVFEEVGGFDPDFFMYSEELDLCHRIARKGYEIKYFEEATAIHKHGGSTTNKDWSMKQRYLSNALLFLKVRGYGGYLLYHMLFHFNTVTNFFAMWLLDARWRQSYRREQKYYFSNFVQYLVIPFLYSKGMGKGKRMLKKRD